MSLSSDLIAEFVKVTKDDKKTKTESTVYGTAVEHNGSIYVRLDGSDQLTPISTVTNVKANDRVSVMIKDHTATVTGNITAPSINVDHTSGLTDKITRVEILVADKVSTTEFDSEIARIEKLVTGDVNIEGRLTANEADIDELQANSVTINQRLTAAEADIAELVVGNLDVSVLDAKYAKITELEATNADVHNLEATYADFNQATADRFTAADAAIADLRVGKLDADTAKILYATVESLYSTNAVIDKLDANVADINTLIFGSASGSTIHSSFANAVIAQLGVAQIKSAMIESISASKIQAGDILTNNVRVKSEDGKLLISDETIQISDSYHVRVQIGKDAANDYSINIWDADGKLMFSQGGITDSAIKDAIIRNDMISDTANIAAHKLDIDSLFEEINGSSKTIKSTKIYLDDKKQTLDVAFESMTSDVAELGETVTTQGTQISAIQGQISSKVWQQDINTATSEMSTRYSTLEQEVDNVSVTVANHTTQIASKADSTTVTNVSNKVTQLETNLSGFKSTVSSTYATKTDVENLEIGGRNLLRNSDLVYSNSSTIGDYGFWNLALDTYSHGIVIEPNQDYVLSYDWSVEWGESEAYAAYVGIGLGSKIGWYSKDIVHSERIPNCDENNVSGRCSFVFSASESLLEDAPYFAMRPIRHTTKTALDGSKWSITNLKLEKGNKATDWTPAPEDIQTAIGELETRIHDTETAIEQSNEAIALRATLTDVATAKSEAVSDASANTKALLKNYSTTSEMNAAIQLKADGITSSVSSTYATKTALDTTNVNVTNAKAAADAAQKDIDDMTIGGTNLLLNTSNTLSEHTMPADMYYLQFGTDIQLEAGETYTFSVYVEKVTEDDVPIHLHIGIGNKGNYNLDLHSWRKSAIKMGEKTSLTYTVTEADVETYKYFAWRLRNEKLATAIRVKEVKLEKGNKATAWSPSPDDMATGKELASVENALEIERERMTEAETIIQQLSESIMTLVTDGNGESLMVQTETGWTFSTAKIQSVVDTTSENLNRLTDDMGDANAAIGALQQAVSDLGVLSDYVKIGVYENEPCIELGESDSDFKLMITNTRIMFMEGSGMPAYVSNQSLHIKKAVVEEELQQGEFVWKARANGNLGLIWKGVTS